MSVGQGAPSAHSDSAHSAPNECHQQQPAQRTSQRAAAFPCYRLPKGSTYIELSRLSYTQLTQSSASCLWQPPHHFLVLLQGKTVVAVTSGANMNFDRLRLVSELADIGASREAMLAVTIPEQPGAFRAFVDAALGDTDIQVTEFKYRCGSRAEYQRCM